MAIDSPALFALTVPNDTNDYARPDHSTEESPMLKASTLKQHSFQHPQYGMQKTLCAIHSEQVRD